MTAQAAMRTTDKAPDALRAEAEVPVALGPNGPGLAAILASAIGVFSLGLLTTLAAAGEGVKEWLAFQERVGPLSGKTTMAGIAWLVSWALLSVLWWKRDVPFTAVIAVSAILLIAGNLLMFPPIFERFEP
ncbi:MAG: hypothetical protein WEE64_04855 [Dehalococcoidia bacterium]